MLAKSPVEYPRFPSVTPLWDSAARRRKEAHILAWATPELYEHWLTTVLKRLQGKPREERIVFVNAWNEWAEGNHLEPDAKYVRGFLEANLRALSHFRGSE